MIKSLSKKIKGINMNEETKNEQMNIIPSNQDNVNNEEETNQAVNLSPWQKVVYIFTDPVKVFYSLRSRPTWVLPLLLIIIMTSLFNVATKDLMLEYRKQMILNSNRIPEDRKDLILEQLENMPAKNYYIQSIGGGLVGLILVYLLAAGVFIFVGNFILGGKATFSQIFALYVWGNMVSLIELPLKAGLALAKGSVQVYTSLAVFMDPAQSRTALFQILNAVDIFNIWRIILWSVGFAVIYRFTLKKSYITVISIYVFYILLSIGLSRLFIF